MLRSEDSQVLVRAAVCAALVLAFVLGITGCVAQKPAVLFCGPGSFQGVQGLVCADPDTAKAMIDQDREGQLRPAPQSYPKPPQKDAI